MSREIHRPGPLIVDVAGITLTPADRELLAHPAVGGVILFTRNHAELRQLDELTTAMRAVRPNLLIVADQEGGRVQRFRDGFTRIAPMRALGRLAETDPDTAEHAAREIAWLMAHELKVVGVDMPLAPVVDLDYGASAVIGDRAFGRDPGTVQRLADAFMAGLAEAGSAATAKHFPGHGFVAADSHARLPVDSRSRDELADDMAPYRGLIGAGLDSIMMAHVRYPAIDDLPASLSQRWIGDVLRREFGFEGCVFCDDLSMGGAAAIGDYPERARLAQAAGCDYLPVCNDRSATESVLDTVSLSDTKACRRRERLHAICGRMPAMPAAENASRLRAAHALHDPLIEQE